VNPAPALLVIEGLPAAGKTTPIRYLASALNADVVKEGAIGRGSEFAERGRAAAILGDEQKSAAMERASRLKLVDRYYYTGVAFELALRRESISLRGFRVEYESMYPQGLFPPTHVLVIDLDVEESLARMRRRDEHLILGVWSSPSFLESLRRFYLALASGETKMGVRASAPPTCLLEQRNKGDWMRQVVDFLP
jgi:thymidylate kinase